MKDARVAKLMTALGRRFPDADVLAVPMPDQPDSGELALMVIGVAENRRRDVDEFASKTSESLWGEEPWTAFVFAMSGKSGGVRYSDLLRAVRRRRAAAPRKRRRPIAGRA